MNDPENGKYQNNFAEQLAGSASQNTSNLAELLKEAGQSQPVLQSQADNVVNRVRSANPAFQSVEFVMGPLKTEESAARKIRANHDGDISKISDLVRGRVVIDNVEQLAAVKAELDKLEVVSFENRFAKPSGTGYRDLNYRVKLPNGHIAEIQVVHREMLKASEQAHVAYERGREIREQATLENRKMTKQERRAFQETLDESWKIYGEVAEQEGLNPLLNEELRNDGRYVISARKSSQNQAQNANGPEPVRQQREPVILPVSEPAGATAGAGKPSVVMGAAAPELAYPPQTQTQPVHTTQEPGGIIAMQDRPDIRAETRHNNPVPSGGGTVTPITTGQPALTTGQKVTGMTAGGLGAILSGYNFYHHFKQGHVTGSVIEGTNLVSSSIGAAESAAPEIVSRMAPGVVQIVERSAVPLMIIGGAYQIATTPEGRKGEAVTGVAVGGVTTAVLMMAGASGAALVALPAAGALAVSGLSKEERIKAIREDQQQFLTAVKPDNNGHTHLRAYADALDALVKDAKDEKTKRGESVPAEDFARNAEGKIDLNNKANLRVIKAHMDQRRSELRQAMRDNDQISAFPDFTKNESKLLVYMGHQRTLHGIEVAEAELNNARLRNFQLVEQTSEQMRQDADRAANNPQVEKTIYQYTVRNGTAGDKDGFVKADSIYPDVPEEVRREFLRNPDSHEPIRQLIYKQDAEGKIAFDEAGQPVVERLVYWKINDPDRQGRFKAEKTGIISQEDDGTCYYKAQSQTPDAGKHFTSAASLPLSADPLPAPQISNNAPAI